MIQPAITVKQPWASLIVEGINDIENRTWPCPQKYIGKRVLIHVGMDDLLKKVKYGDTIQFMTDEQIEAIVRQRKGTEIFGTRLPNGAIIGSVEIVDCVINYQSIWAEKSEGIAIGGHIFVHKPENKPIYNWVLANPIKFPEPIPCKGKLSFWDYPIILAEPEGVLFSYCQLPVSKRDRVASIIPIP